MKRSRETIALILLLLFGLGLRLAFISRFPTIPFSDFNALVYFGQYLHDHGLISNGWFWELFNPGLPLILCGLFHVFPSIDAAGLARLATALVCGFLPILPFVIWRGVLPLWVRVLTGAALALWPGQIFFTGVVAQDNWAIPPAVALGALAVSALYKSERARPIAAGLLYVTGVAIRQEMLIVLLPLFLAAAGLNLRVTWRRAAAATLTVGLLLVALAAYRYACTGRFSLSSQHAGLAILGAYVPGATADGWTDPLPFIASTRPELLYDRKALYSQTSRLAFREALRRPAFQAARILASVSTLAITGESNNLYWSLQAPEVLPAAIHERGVALVDRWSLPLHLEMRAIQGLFLAAVIVGILRRNLAILALALAALLKYGLHAVTVSQGRYFYPATALEILAIAVAAYEIHSMVPASRRPLLVRALAVGVGFSLGLFLYAPRLAAFVHSSDIDQSRTYHFPLESPARNAMLSCAVDRGLLATLTQFPWSAAIRIPQTNPAPGDAAVATCELTGSGEPSPITLQVLDSYVPGGLTGRIVQRVEIDGVEVFSLDIAQVPGSGWANISLGKVGMGTPKKKVTIEVKALHPDSGVAWGDASLTAFQLVDTSSIPHLAAGRPAFQSSTLPGQMTTIAQKAVDSKTDGIFFHGSVTHTNSEPNPWWQVDLGTSVPIGSIVIWNRTDECCIGRLNDYWVFVSDTPFAATETPATLKSRAGTWSSHQTAIPRPSTTITTNGERGRFVRVQLSGTNYLSLAEVQVFGK